MPSEHRTAGIDHGTTNSCIAVLESGGPRVIPVLGRDIMPSCVYLSDHGRRLVGHPAVEAILNRKTAEGDGHTGYKPYLGMDNRYAFTASGKVMTAPELGGIVLAELTKAFGEETGGSLEACVIARPADFEQSAVEGTRKAAELAGIKHFQLLPEPVAAALAYGFSTENERAQWMVFDLGAGTLDVSLVIVRKGNIIVPPNGTTGDPAFGGRKFDREFLAPVIAELKKQYKLNGFGEHHPKYGPAWNRLRFAVEQAKIRLSTAEKATVELLNDILCQDDNGKDVTVSIPVTRAQYEKLVAADFERAANFCRALLAKNRLTPNDIGRLIMVGGPTKTPYLRKILQDRLQMELDTSVDPMTAVAVGAAIHAAMTEWEGLAEEAAPAPAEGETSLQLEYERKSRISSYLVFGTVKPPKGRSAKGMKVEMKRADKLWTSGSVPVAQDGTFSIEAMLVESATPHRSDFTTTVFDASGTPVATVEEPRIYFPDPGGIILSLDHSLCVAEQNLRLTRLCSRGQALVARGEEEFVTTRDVRRGSKEDIIQIPIVEPVRNIQMDESDRADCSVHVGSLTIRGSDQKITCDIPAGTALHVYIIIDKENKITARAEIPLLDAEFEAVFAGEPHGITLDQIQKRWEAERKRLAEVETLQRSVPIAGVEELLARLREQNLVAAIDTDVGRAAEGEQEAVHRVWRRILEFSGSLNLAWQLQAGPRIRCRLDLMKQAAEGKDREHIADLEKAVARGGSPADFERLEDECLNLDKKIRHRPYWQLHLHVAALGGIRVSQHQHEVHQTALEFLQALDARGAPDTLTNEDLRRIAEHDRHLEEAYPDLRQYVEKFLAGLPDGTRDDPEQAYGSTVQRKTH